MRKSRKKSVRDPTRSLAKYHFEAQLCRKYGLKNKSQLGVARALLLKYRAITKSPHEAIVAPAMTKLVKLGIIATPQKKEILALTMEHFLARRLQTIIAKKYDFTPRKARQLITHGHVRVNNTIKRFPGFLIRVDSEPTISVATVEQP